MSTLLYINGFQIDLEENQKISRTLQVNDIGKLSNRQANYTNKFKAPKTANNIRVFDGLSLVGSRSNIPYQRNVASLFDDSGECIVYNGWANISSSDQRYYDVVIYDGSIDFYKAIEGKVLTDIGLSDLNHLKNLEGVLETWTDNTLPYRYLHADYNGKLFFDGKVNIDYYIPCANVKFIWDKIFEFVGMTYTGGLFNTEAFKNLWLTYPKPVGSTSQQIEIINTQNYTQPLSFTQANSTPEGGIFYATYYEASLLQNCFTHPLANSVSQTDGNCRLIDTVDSGLFRFRLSGSINFFSNESANYGILLLRRNTTTNTTTYETIIDGFHGPANIDVTYPLTINENEIVGLMLSRNGAPYTTNSQYQPGIITDGNLSIEFSKILGDVVNFEDALLDFPIKDFVNEVLQRYCLTPFPEKYTKNIDFLTAQEWLQTQNVYDWSNKNPKKLSSTTTIGDYAQKNHFKFRYNDENADHNNGIIHIENKNLNDETTVIESKTYSGERLKTQFIVPVTVYPFWAKEVKDNVEGVNYKPLDKRFYFLKSADYNSVSGVDIGSEVFSEEATVNSMKIATDSRMSFKELIEDYYNPIGSILNSAKLHTFEIFLNVQEYNSFDFRNLIYIEQEASYFICNKISNFIKGKPTKVELIEVDYFDELTDGPELNDGTYIEINNLETTGCQVTIDFSTDAEFPSLFRVIAFKELFGGIPGPNDIYEETFSSETLLHTVVLPSSGTWTFRLFLNSFGNSIYSNVESIFVIGCEAPEPIGTFITITNIQTIAVTGNNRVVKLTFDTDLPFPTNLTADFYNVFAGFGFYPLIFVNSNEVTITLIHKGGPFNMPLAWGITLSHGTITSNSVGSAS